MNTNNGKHRRLSTGSQIAIAVTAAIMAVGAPSGALSQDYPDKAVTIVVPFDAGGPTDLLGRVLADALSKKWDKPVIIDNRPGATGAIGAAHVAKSAPDGYTLLLGSNAVNGTNELTRPKTLPYKTDEAFQPLALLAKTPYVLIVRKDSSYQTLQDLVDYAKANPGKLNYSTTGKGGTSHFATELMNLTLGIETVHIPFTGAGPAAQALLAGTVDFRFAGATTISGDTRPLAVFWNKRMPQFPDTPTLQELGHADGDYYAWYGLYTPKGTAEDVAAKIETDVLEVASTEAFTASLVKLGFEPSIAGHDELKKEMEASFAKSRRVIEAVPDLVTD